MQKHQDRLSSAQASPGPWHLDPPENVARCLNDVNDLSMTDAFHVQAVDTGDGVPCQEERGSGQHLLSGGRIPARKGRGSNPTESSWTPPSTSPWLWEEVVQARTSA